MRNLILRRALVLAYPLLSFALAHDGLNRDSKRTVDTAFFEIPHFDPPPVDDPPPIEEPPPHEDPPPPVGGGQSEPPGHVPSKPGHPDGEPYEPPVVSQLAPDADSPNKDSEGTADESTNPCDDDEEECHEMLEKALDLLKDLLEKALDNLPSSSSSSTATLPTPSGPAAYPTLMPNRNASEWMDMSCYSDLFTEDEYSMLKNDPVCFFANFERLYANYAGYAKAYSSASASASASQATQTTPTPSSATTPPPTKRTVGVRDVISQIESQENNPGSCTQNVDAQTLYLSYLPDQLRLVYNWSPSSLTVTATSTTTCSGLRDLTLSSFATPYVEFGYKKGYAPPAATSTSQSTKSNAGSQNEHKGAAASTHPSVLFGGLLVGMVMLVAIL